MTAKNYKVMNFLKKTYKNCRKKRDFFASIDHRNALYFPYEVFKLLDLSRLE